MNLHPLHWKHGVLTIGLPGKTLIFLYCVVTWLQTLLRAMKEKRGGCERRALLDLNRKDALRRNFYDKLVPGKRRRKPT